MSKLGNKINSIRHGTLEGGRRNIPNCDVILRMTPKQPKRTPVRDHHLKESKLLVGKFL